MSLDQIRLKQLNIDAAALAAVRAYSQQSGTHQLVVKYQGVTIIDDATSDEPVDVFAIQKGLVSLLIGVAEDKYLIETCDSINHLMDPEWTSLSPWDEAKLTVETLLNMTTGMNDELAAQGVVGESWRYNNVAYNYLKRILEEQTGQSMQALSKQWLFESAAMNSTHWVERAQVLPDGRPLTGLMSTANDIVKLGELVLKHGDGLVPKYYIDQIAKPGSNENPAWGWCWWNNNQSSFRLPMREEKLIQGVPNPLAPADMISARGAFENVLNIVPSMQLIVARTAKERTGVPAKVNETQGRATQEGEAKAAKPAPFERTFWGLLTKALPC
jgi:CubicO group peptidase (beta-lactamase class C family)